VNMNRVCPGRSADAALPGGYRDHASDRIFFVDVNTTDMARAVDLTRGDGAGVRASGARAAAGRDQAARAFFAAATQAAILPASTP
jgi:hypothetical protein